MKRYIFFLIVMIINSSTLFSQENLFEKFSKDYKISKTAKEKIEKFKTRNSIKAYESVSLISDIELAVKFKGIFNIFERSLEFEVTKDFGTNEDGIHSYKAILKDGGYAIISCSDFGIAASIWYKNTFFSVDVVEDKIYFVSETDMDKIRKEDNSNDYLGTSRLGKVESITSENSVTSSAVVKVYVAYTAAVAQNYVINTLLTNCETTTNNAFEISEIDSEIDIVGSSQLTYTESGDDETDLTRFKNNGDSYLDDIHNLRNQNQADICVLLVNTLDAKGMAASIGAEFNSAFVVVRADAAVGDYSFAHELGHLFGCRHEYDPGTTPYSYAHGYHWEGTLLEYSLDNEYYETIMANFYTEKYDRIPYFSNPAVCDDDDIPMGTVDKNNASAIDTRASYLDSFQPIVTSGTISENEWWAGTITISSDVTVSSGVQL